MNAAGILDAIRKMRDETYLLTCEQGMEVTLPENAYDQLMMHLSGIPGLECAHGKDDPHFTFEGVTVWRKQSYRLT